MYTSFYNLAEMPFTINTDPRFLWLGDKHREALAHLNYGLMEADGYVVLTGDVGVGKTTLVNALLEGVDENTLTVNLSHPSLSIMEFFRFFAKTLGEQKELTNKVDYLFFFEDALLKAHNEGRKVLLIIDEAHKLSEELLEEIRLLSNIEHQGNRLINIFFVGQNELKDILLNPQFRALRQRITLFYDIKPLTAGETAAYIKHRLQVAGGDGEVFTAEAADVVHEFSKGYPRLINTICGRSMLTGYISEKKSIDATIVRECSRELEFLDPTQSSKASAGNQFPERTASVQKRPIQQRFDSQKSTPPKKEKAVKPLQRTQVKPEATIEKKKVRQEKTASSGVKRPRMKLPDRLGNIVAVFIIFGILVFYLFFENGGSLSWLNRDHDIPAETELLQEESISPGENSLPNDSRNVPKPSTSPDVQVPASSVTVMPREESITESASQQLAVTQEEQQAESEEPEGQQESSEIIEETIAASRQETVATTEMATSENDEDLSPGEAEIVTSDEVETVAEPVGEKVGEPVAEQGEETDPEPSPAPPTPLDLAAAALFNKQYQTVLDLLDAEESLLDEEQREMYTVLYNKALLGKAEQLMPRFPAEAKKILRQVVEADAENSRPFFLLGKLHTQDKEYTQAIDAYQQAARLEPNFPDTFFNLGFLYATTGMYEEAEELFKQTVALEPSYLGKALFNLAVIQQRMGKEEESLANLRRAGELDPQNEKVKEYLQQAEQNGNG